MTRRLAKKSGSREPKVFSASPVAGDGKVYLISETGETIVIKAGREFQVLARNDIDERLVASPAISGGQLFMRTDNYLFCIGKVFRTRSLIGWQSTASSQR